MIVSELIELLQKYKPEARVLGRGYESGYNDVEFRILGVVKNPDDAWYEGDYLLPKEGQTPDFFAVVLN